VLDRTFEDVVGFKQFSRLTHIPYRNVVDNIRSGERLGS
jgi:hypothetical protein